MFVSRGELTLSAIWLRLISPVFRFMILDFVFRTKWKSSTVFNNMSIRLVSLEGAPLQPPHYLLVDASDSGDSCLAPPTNCRGRGRGMLLAAQGDTLEGCERHVYNEQ